MLRSGTMIATASLLVVGLTMVWAAEKKFEKKFTVSPGGTFTLRTDVGEVLITGTESNEVSVVANIRGREKDVNEFEVTADQTSSGVDVRGEGRGGTSWWGRSHDLEARFTVGIPKTYNVRASTAGGDVAVKTVKGSVKAETSGGDVEARQIEGDLHMETSGGDVRAERITGSVRMGTSGGDVEVAVVKGDVDVETSGGSIMVKDVEGRVSAETSGGDIVIGLAGANVGVNASTSGGNIEILVAKSVAADIDASTSGGAVVCDIPISVVGRIEEDHIKGTINGGGKLIRAHTSGGDIRIRAMGQ